MKSARSSAPLLRDVGARRRLHRRRHAVLRQVESGQWRRTDHAHRRQRRRRLGLLRRRERRCERTAQQQRCDAPRLRARAGEAKLGARRDGGDVGRAPGQRIATPQGSLPTGTSAIFAFCSCRSPRRSPSGRRRRRACLPSGVSAMFQGRWPTPIVATALPIRGRSPKPSHRRRSRRTAHLPSGCRATPLLRRPALIFAAP